MADEAMQLDQGKLYGMEQELPEALSEVKIRSVSEWKQVPMLVRSNLFSHSETEVSLGSIAAKPHYFSSGRSEASPYLSVETGPTLLRNTGGCTRSFGTCNEEDGKNQLDQVHHIV